MTAPSLDGRRFGSTENTVNGEVGGDTSFEYFENDGEIWGTYSGGEVRRGYLVGTRDGDALDFRYTHLNTKRETSSGHCLTRIVVLDDGRLRLEETWEWESRPGSGFSAVEELRD